MKKIVYYVASSLDGFISGVNGDTSEFTANGEGVQKYLNDLMEFKTVIMGRKTYEFGYKFGLKPGAPAYPHMNHYIFSQSLILDNPESNIKVVRKIDLAIIEKIREQSESDIYLCGGGHFAGWLLEYLFLLEVIREPDSKYNSHLDTLFGSINRYSVFYEQRMAYEILKSKGFKSIKNGELRSEIINLYDYMYKMNSKVEME